MMLTQDGSVLTISSRSWETRIRRHRRPDLLRCNGLHQSKIARRLPEGGRSAGVQIHLAGGPIGKVSPAYGEPSGKNLRLQVFLVRQRVLKHRLVALPVEPFNGVVVCPCPRTST